MSLLFLRHQVKKEMSKLPVREKILKATYVLINLKGLRFSLHNLAYVLQKSKAVLYHYFPSKFDLVLAVVDYYIQHMPKDRHFVCKLMYSFDLSDTAEHQYHDRLLAKPEIMDIIIV